MRKEKIHFKKRQDNDFYRVVKARVYDWFEREGISPHANKTMWVKFSCHLLAYLLLFTLIFSDHFEGVTLVMLFVLFGVTQALMGFNISHDALHGAFSRSKRVNRYLGYFFDFCGESSFVWKTSHNVQHHTFTNISGHDDDINKAPLLRFSPHDPWAPHHRYQHLFILPLYSMITLSWIYWGDWQAFIQAGKNGQTNLKDWMIFTGFKGLNLFIMVLLPFIALSVPVWLIVTSLILMNMVASLVLSVVFQMAHLVEGVEFPLPDRSGKIEDEWAAHELKTTSNFATHNQVLSWFLGGLNFQVEHHLFPQVCHVHYSKIQSIVKATAKEFGLPYNEQATFSKAFISHLKTLKKFGAKAKEVYVS
ncbi:MAG: acyl-CoA desaturase [Chlamydiia bacterium]|nr:acyl-CoA desaturase [Chlamydiia bacterium]